MDIICLIIGTYILTSAFKDDTKNNNLFGGWGYELKDSKIHGTGVFSTGNHKKGEILFTAITRDTEITKQARYVNHCNNPTTILEKRDGEWILIALRDIKSGDEITADYNNTPDFIKKPDPSWTC